MNENLFNSVNNTALKPLAERMRPKTFSEVVGQQHILGEGKLLNRLIKANRVTSSIFYGPPGTGKTTIANLIAKQADAEFLKLNATTTGIAEVKELCEKAKKTFLIYGKKTYMLVDECHRWNKLQSDSLLASLEEGYIVFLGSTTENPAFSMTNAINSRCTVFEFKRLGTDDIVEALERAIDDENGLKHYNVATDDKTLHAFASRSGGDLRASLNALELACLTTEKNKDAKTILTSEIAAECLQKKAVKLDDDIFYHILSAYCKSLRGSDETAALYYANRLIEAGCEPELLARRLIAHASEDVGMADSYALTMAMNALLAIKNLGMPEGNLALTHAIIYVCQAPKSNAVVVAKDMAIDDARNHADDNIPAYLRNHTQESKDYKYPHDYPGGVVEQQYLPESLKNRVYFKKR